MSIKILKINFNVKFYIFIKWSVKAINKICRHLNSDDCLADLRYYLTMFLKSLILTSILAFVTCQETTAEAMKLPMLNNTNGSYTDNFIQAFNECKLKFFI